MDATSAPLPSSIGRYSIVGPLGQGAMGRVLLGRDPVLDRAVAVKLLRDDLSIPHDQKEALLERMRQEARASARVSHPNIVALFDMGEDAMLGLFLVFEYAEGTTLKERLKRGPVGPEAAAKLARELGDALTTAHEAGVLHRDIKPENIILTRTGAKIADFGIARLPDSTLTRDGGLLGTPAYSAPESIAHGTFSPLSDQFSMATTLYEAISAQRAFPGEDAVAVATKISTESPRPIAERMGLDPHVDVTLARALSKSEAARFVSCADFGNALAESLLVAPRTQMPTLPDEHHERTVTVVGESRPARVALGGAAVGALLAIAGFQLTAHLKAVPEEDPLPLPPVSEPAATNPVGWLAPSPPEPASEPQRKPKRDSAPSVASVTPAILASPSDAGTDGALEAATPAAGASAAASAPAPSASAPKRPGDAGAPTIPKP